MSQQSSDNASDKPKSKHASDKRLTPKEWAKLGALWEIGNHSLEQLNQMSGIAKETISRKLKRLGYVKGARAMEHAERVAERMHKAAEADVSVIANRIKQTKENHYDWSAALARMTMAEIAEAKQKNRPLATTLPNLKAIEKAMSVLEMSRKERFAVLGVDKVENEANDLPDLLVEELSAEEVEYIRNKKQQDDILGATEASFPGLEGGEDEDDDDVIDEGGDE